MRKANKKLASAIVLGLMLAVPVGASAAEVTDPINPDVSKEYVSDENVHIVNNGDKRVVIEVRDKDHDGPDYDYNNYRTYGIYGKITM